MAAYIRSLVAILGFRACRAQGWFLVIDLALDSRITQNLEFHGLGSLKHDSYKGAVLFGGTAKGVG